MPQQSLARFADTSYFLALIIPDDELHLKAVSLASDWSGQMVTTDFVQLSSYFLYSQQDFRAAIDSAGQEDESPQSFSEGRREKAQRGMKTIVCGRLSAIFSLRNSASLCGELYLGCGVSRAGLIEIANYLCAGRSRQVFPIFHAAISRENRMTIIPASGDWMRRGIDLYARRADKDWSLTDCISFEVMRQNNLLEALTGDHHFQQAGFNVLMK